MTQQQRFNDDKHRISEHFVSSFLVAQACHDMPHMLMPKTVSMNA
jgi:hypothetical protein